MKPKAIYLLLAAVLVFIAASHLKIFKAGAQSVSPEAEAVLNAAEGVFKAMKARDYPAIWEGLTAKSKDEIVASVLKAAKKAGQEFTPERLRQDFAAGGPQAKAYWDAYLEVFNPDMILEQSKWSLGTIKDDAAAVITHYRKSENPAILILKKEGGAWRLGLEETFGPRKWLLGSGLYF